MKKLSINNIAQCYRCRCAINNTRKTCTHTQLNNLVVKCQDRDGDKSWMVEQGTLDEEVEKQ